jgi:hypothetical protein
MTIMAKAGWEGAARKIILRHGTILNGIENDPVLAEF